MRRRDFIAGLCATAWPVVARAQQPERMRRIGVLMPFDENDPVAIVSPFTQALADLGWTDGRNVRTDTPAHVGGQIQGGSMAPPPGPGPGQARTTLPPFKF